MKRLTEAQDSVALEEPEDLRRFKMVLACGEMSPAALAQSLRSLGWPAADADAVWIAPATQRKLAWCDNDHDWQSEFDCLPGGARKHGRIEEKTGAVRVQIERAVT